MYTFYQSFERILDSQPQHLFFSDDDWENFLIKNFPLNFFDIGHSREGSKLHAVKMGTGHLKASIIAGCHADEPTGPFMLQSFLLWLKKTGSGNELLKNWTFFVIPQMNPDGALRNKNWMALPLSLKAYLLGSVRELPGDDIEFGFPLSKLDQSIRPENKAAADFLTANGPFHAHFSLHSLSLGGGAWFLIGKKHNSDSFQLQAKLKGIAEKLGLPLYDIDRKGEKGFFRLSAGFSTTPSSEAMRSYLKDQNQPELAEKIKLSSMEFVENLGGEPLTLVSEIPNFISPFLQTVKSIEEQKFKILVQNELQRCKVELKEGKDELFNSTVNQFAITPVLFKDQIRIQFRMILCALSEVKSNSPHRFMYYP